MVEFEWSRKHADSLITKLLAKKENIAADVYDRLRFRMVTQTEDELMFVLREVTAAAGAVQLRHPRPVAERHHQPAQGHRIVAARCRSTCPICWTCPTSPADKGPAPQNEFSGPSYRVINFVGRPAGAHRPLPGPAGRRPAVRRDGAVVFVLTEFQIIDARTASDNEAGENSHARYKERQLNRVRARLMHGS